MNEERVPCQLTRGKKKRYPCESPEKKKNKMGEKKTERNKTPSFQFSRLEIRRKRRLRHLLFQRGFCLDPPLALRQSLLRWDASESAEKTSNQRASVYTAAVPVGDVVYRFEKKNYNSSGEMEGFVETYLCKSVCHTSIARMYRVGTTVRKFERLKCALQEEYQGSGRSIGRLALSSLRSCVA